MIYLLPFYPTITVDSRHIKLVVMRGYKIVYKILFMLKGTLKMHEHQGKLCINLEHVFGNSTDTLYSTDEWPNCLYHSRS
jgi:hypothetical protein